MPDIKVRVGAQNAIKVLSSASGGNALFADTATNVIGGIASVTQLDSSGISTIQSLRVSDTLRITGLSTFIAFWAPTLTLTFAIIVLPLPLQEPFLKQRLIW